MLKIFDDRSKLIRVYRLTVVCTNVNQSLIQNQRNFKAKTELKSRSISFSAATRKHTMVGQKY